MKFNWGTGIFIVMASFIGLMAWFTVRAASEKSELVADDYYERELKYQGELDHLNNTSALGEDVVALVDKDRLSLQFPQHRVVQAHLELMRPSDQRADRSMDLHSDSTGAWHTSTDSMLRGAYRMLLDWNVDGTTFRTKQDVYLP